MPEIHPRWEYHTTDVPPKVDPSGELNAMEKDGWEFLQAVPAQTQDDAGSPVVRHYFRRKPQIKVGKSGGYIAGGQRSIPKIR